MSEFPSIQDMLRNLADTSVGVMEFYKKNGVILADNNIVDKRINICAECEFMSSTVGIARCKVCGCGMALKVRLAGSTCPIKKW